MGLACSGLNARLGSSIVVKSDGWTDITGWRSVEATIDLSEADGGIDSKGRFYPAQQGAWVYGYLPQLLRAHFGVFNEHRQQAVTILRFISSVFQQHKRTLHTCIDSHSSMQASSFVLPIFVWTSFSATQRVWWLVLATTEMLTPASALSKEAAGSIACHAHLLRNAPDAQPKHISRNSNQKKWLQYQLS